MQKLTPCLLFANEAEQAAKFYISIFKKNSKILKVARYGESGPGPKGSVLTVMFRLNGQEFMGLNGGAGHTKFNEAVSFMVPCKTQKEIDYYWSRLLRGGKEIQCGWLIDKFGVRWQIAPAGFDKLLTGDPKKVDRYMRAMMGMVKLDIKKLKDAYYGK